jgi:fumarylacetoacetate (FAA) hydrolase
MGSDHATPRAMRLATLRDGTRDGRLVVVRADGRAVAHDASIPRTMQAALDGWAEAEPALRALSADPRAPWKPLQVKDLLAPLPRAYEWVDGSAFLNHVRLVRKARGAELPPTLETDPLVYQGGSGAMLAAEDNWVLPDPAWGLDFEGEVVAVLGDVPRGTPRAAAAARIKLLCLANDVTYRQLVPAELAKGFGFFQSKPATAFSPFCVTPDELGDAWRDGRVHLRLRTTWNDELVGDVEAGPEMHFSFFDLVEHIARTRAFTAGTLLGSGTVSNADASRGVSCLAERRMIEILSTGQPRTRFMKVGDTVTIEMLDATGRSVFGRLSQKVVAL